MDWGEQTDVRTEGWPRMLGGDGEGASREAGSEGCAAERDGCLQQGLASQAGVAVLGLRWERTIGRAPVSIYGIVARRDPATGR